MLSRIASFTILLLLISCNSIFAQQFASETQETSDDLPDLYDSAYWSGLSGKKYITTTLTAPLEHNNAFRVGYLFQHKQNRMWQLLLGYVYGLDNLFSLGELAETNEEVTNVRGGQIALEYRWLLNGRTYPENSKLFLGLSPYFNFTTFNAEVIGGYSCNEPFGNCLYYRLFEVSNQRLTTGINLHLGKVYYLNKLVVTFYGGLGFNYVANSSNTNGILPPDNFYNRDGNQRQIPEGFNPGVKFGLEIGWRLN